ncbi:MAG: shikimate kinase [marine bacterium B5-7]|nr:MAG: shikimate kinase [marine bacterium B5-7]
MNTDDLDIHLNKSQSIFLIGPMGAGKTTIGRYLAKELQRDFVDTDEEIVSRTGADLAWIYDVEGDAGFRKREQKMIDELTQRPGIVLATGGGAVLHERNRTALSSRGFVIYLEVSVDQQVVRTEKDQRRPSLRNQDREQFFSDMQRDRDTLYESIADLTVSTNKKSVRNVAVKLLKMLQG